MIDTTFTVRGEDRMGTTINLQGLDAVHACMIAFDSMTMPDSLLLRYFEVVDESDGEECTPALFMFAQAAAYKAMEAHEHGHQDTEDVDSCPGKTLALQAFQDALADDHLGVVIQGYKRAKISALTEYREERAKQEQDVADLSAALDSEDFKHWLQGGTES